MTAVPDPISAEDHLARVFELDDLFDAMTTGRLCGKPMEGGVAQTMLFLLERIGWAPDAAELANALPHYPEQIGLAEVRSTMVNLGYRSTLMPILGNRLRLCPPSTLVCDDRGALWLIRTTRYGSELFQPGDMEQVRRVQSGTYYRTIQFDARGLGTPVNPVDGNATWSSSLFYRFMPELRMLFVLTVFSGLTAILVAFGVKAVFDTVIPSRNPSTLQAIIMGLALIAGAELILRRIRAGVVSRIAGRVDYILGTMLFGKLMRLPTQMLAGASESDQFARLRQFETLRDALGGPIVLLALELGVAGLLLVAVTAMAWPIALVLVGLALAFVVVAIALRPGVARAGIAVSAAQSRFNAANLEVQGCRQSIRRRGLYAHVARQQRDNLRALIRARRRQSVELRLLDSLALVSLPTAGATAIGTGALLVVQGTMTAGQLIAVTILTWRLFAPIQQTIQLLPKLPELLRLLAQIDLFFKLPEAPRGRQGDVTRPCQGEVAVNNLVVRFPGAILPTLVGDQFKVPRGKLITVTGASGSGKSTLLRVLAGNIVPQSGVVLVDDLNLQHLSQGYRNRYIAHVAQQPIYIYGTVAQNLRLSAPGASDAHINEVLGELGLDTWVQSLPDGIDTRIDPVTMPDLLPPGARTLLAVAQALMTDPAILLLDEPAGGLDSRREASLMRALQARRGRMTTFLVTHRPSLIRQSDGLIYLNAGSMQLKTPQPRERATA